MGLSISASEKVRVAAEKEMPREVGAGGEGRCVLGVKREGKSEGCPPQKPHGSTQGPSFPNLWLPLFLLSRNLPETERTGLDAGHLLFRAKLGNRVVLESPKGPKAM